MPSSKAIPSKQKTSTPFPKGVEVFCVQRLPCGRKAGSGLTARETRSAGVYFSAMRNRRKNRQRRGLPPPCGIYPAFLGCQRLPLSPGRRAVTIPGEKEALFGSVTAGMVCTSPVFGPTCGASRPTAAGRGRHPPDLRPWWKEWKLSAE